MNIPPKKPLAFMHFATNPHKVWAVGAICCVIVAASIEMSSNLIFKEIIDSATAASRGEGSFRMVWMWALLSPLTYLLAEGFWRSSGFLGMQWMTRTKAYGYKQLFMYLTRQSANYFNSRFAGALTNKISNAAEGVANLQEKILWQFIPLIISFIAGLALAVSANIVLAGIIMVWVLGFITVNFLLVRRKQKHSYAFADARSRLRGAMVDSASNIAAVHQSGHHEHEIEYLGSYIEHFRRSNVRNWLASEFILVSANFQQALFVTLMLAGCVYFLQQKLISIGEVVMIINITLHLMRQIFFIGHEMNNFMDDYGQVSEGLEELLVPHEIVDKADARPLLAKHESIEFKDVLFQYGPMTVFENFDLTIPSGQKVGLVGHSGAGKTTLTNILLRQYDIQGGDILIDAQSVKDITQDSIRRHIAIVPQDISLFHRTIFENIRYGRLGASDEEVMHAAELAQADEFIRELPEGYSTMVGERGVKLSGGQRQRIAIARAFLKNAPILILDEATSALDSHSEAAIQRALLTLMEGKTVLAIAHRLSTLKAMDRIIVLEGGKVVEDGTHEELIAREGIYADLWKGQISGFLQE